MNRLVSAILGYYGFNAEDGTVSNTMRFLAMWLAERVRHPLARA
jgi:hypothetical protein